MSSLLSLFLTTSSSLTCIHFRLPDGLYLDENDLTGSIPFAITLLTNLGEYRCARFVWCFSLASYVAPGSRSTTDFFLLFSVVRLDLHGNRFSGGFNCPDRVERCYISCDDWPSEEKNSTCRSL